MNWHGVFRPGSFGKNNWNDNPNLVFGRFPARGIVEIEAATVPEPASVLGLLAVSALGAGSTLKRKLQSKSLES
jgi:hypothetical protein